MRITLIALALAASTAQAAEPSCYQLAKLSEQIARAKQDGMPQAAIASSLRAQYREDAEADRERNAIVERVIPAAYGQAGDPEQAAEALDVRCRAGEFSSKPAKETGP